MSDTYVECMVKTKPSALYNILKYILIALCIFVGLVSLVFGRIVLLTIAIVLGVGAYFVNNQCNIEYEYLYLDKEITIDKIMNQTKRKRVAVYELDKIEIFAPIRSYHLDNYLGRNVKETDFSSGIEEKPDRRYAFYYNGTDKIILQPNDEMVKVLKNVAPRKVFND